MRRGRRMLLTLAAASVLAACATPQRIAKNEEGDAATTISRVGRFALRVQRPMEEPEAIQGGFAWQDDGRKLVLDLANPLGTTLARVESGPDGAMLRESNGRETFAADPDGLAARALGSPIPVAGLRDWLRGRVADAPRGQVSARDEKSRATAFEQDGWDVRVSQYDDTGPVRLHMTRAEPGRTIDLRLVITE
ncbi:outer membrane lipoprotein LolB [Pigmentiphaga aceris]|uniref:Outer-membrane lipoprotein LolB n=2 Tax=Pigmentiphaga aceris TaxID=1940612 RepID=A0A5C0B3U6_9BURK|nr:outer membrane lipoprotein LolB [Pigmentiphaga aceris]